MDGFRKFSSHWFGSWVINGLSVVAFILVLKLLVASLPNSGPVGAGKSAVMSV